MKDIVILGSGGFAKEVAFLIEEINRSSITWNILGFITNDKSMLGKKTVNIVLLIQMKI